MEKNLTAQRQNGNYQSKLNAGVSKILKLIGFYSKLVLM